ncbi:MAG: MASE3 domain-containing protein [Pseudohongiellaceae bacterium]
MAVRDFFIRDGELVRYESSMERPIVDWLVQPTAFALFCLVFLPFGFQVFHFWAESGAIIVGVMAMVTAGITYRYFQNSFLLIVSIGLGWSSLLDLGHTMTYSGMGFLATDDANLPTQIWLLARYLQAASLLAAVLLIDREQQYLKVHSAMALYTLVATISVSFGYFPVAWDDVIGLTPFKIVSEFVIVALVILAAVLLQRHRARFPSPTFKALMAGIFCVVLSEVCFTLYFSVTDWINATGHILKIYAYWFFFRALVFTTLEKPVEDQEQLTLTLGERVKELTGLQDITLGVVKPDVTEHSLLQSVVERLPAAFMRPNHARVAVISDWGVFGDPEAIAHGSRLTRSLTAKGQRVGQLIAGYTEERPWHGEDFLREEQQLIELVGRHMENVLSILFERRQVLRLSRLYELLSATNRAVVRSQTPAQLLEKQFQALVGSGFFPLVFIAEFPDRDDIPHIDFLKGLDADARDDLARTLKEVTRLLWPQGEPAADDLFRVLMLAEPPPELDLAVFAGSELKALGLIPLLMRGENLILIGMGVKDIAELQHANRLQLEEMSLDLRFAFETFLEQKMRQAAESRASESESRFQSIFEYSPLPAMLLDGEGEQIRLVNRAYYDWLGSKAEQCHCMSQWMQLFPVAEERGRLREHWLELLKGIATSSMPRFLPELNLLDSAGRRIVARAYLARVNQEVLVSWTDLTEIREGEARLRENEQRFRTMIEDAGMPIWVYRQGRFIYTNPGFCRLLGTERGELEGARLTEVFDTGDDNGKKLLEALQPLERTDLALSIVRMQLPQGETIAMSVQVSSIAWEDDRAYIAIGENVTERLKVEDELRRSHKLLNELSAQIPGVIYQYRLFPDGHSSFPFASRHMTEIYEYTPDDVREDASVVFERLHPDDRQEVEASLQKSADEMTDWRCDYRVQLPHKGLRWHSGFARPVRLPDGSVLWHGFIQDATERKELERELAAHYQTLEKSMKGTLQVLERMIEFRDPYTAGHERRVGIIAHEIAMELGMTNKRAELLELAGMIHDIGKIAVPTEILTKPTGLSAAEFEIVKAHAQVGYEIVKNVPLPEGIADIIWQHHERLDGSGYPRGLNGDEIMLEAKILAVADVLESMASHRPYRPALGVDAALEELQQHTGKLYDARAVKAVTRLIRDKGLDIANL